MATQRQKSPRKTGSKAGIEVKQTGGFILLTVMALQAVYQAVTIWLQSVQIE